LVGGVRLAALPLRQQVGLDVVMDAPWRRIGIGLGEFDRGFGKIGRRDMILR